MTGVARDRGAAITARRLQFVDSGLGARRATESGEAAERKQKATELAAESKCPFAPGLPQRPPAQKRATPEQVI
jgi:hypothetical protein